MLRLRALTGALAACALALPAVSHAAPAWQRVADPAPGSVAVDDGSFWAPTVTMTVADGTPYVATHSRAGKLMVNRPNAAGTSWRQVGHAINHTPFTRDDTLSMTAAGSVPWIAWTEHLRQGGRQLRVARLVGNEFKEVAAARPTGGAGAASIAVLDGRPYVAYATGQYPDEDVRVVRLAPDGRSFRHVESGL